MFTLKIRWVRSEGQEILDQNTIFLQADSIEVGNLIESPDEMQAWEPDSFFNYQVKVSEATEEDPARYMPARLIQIRKENQPSVWYLASMAWLLGPDGKTIERLI